MALLTAPLVRAECNNVKQIFVIVALVDQLLILLKRAQLRMSSARCADFEALQLLRRCPCFHVKQRALPPQQELTTVKTSWSSVVGGFVVDQRALLTLRRTSHLSLFKSEKLLHERNDERQAKVARCWNFGNCSEGGAGLSLDGIFGSKKKKRQGRKSQERVQGSNG